MTIKTPEHDKLFEHLDDFHTLSLFADYLLEKNVHITQDDIFVFLCIDPVSFAYETKLLKQLATQGTSYQL